MLLIVTVVALAAVFVARSLPRVADRAQELRTGRMNRSEQVKQHTRAAAREREPSCAASAVVVQWSIAQLTLVEALIAAAGQRGQSASLTAAQQQQRASVQ